ncbi:MAG: transcriptional regulator [Flavobacteriales bacterium]|nr:transcriptional regulator [Flavobacteriales bacterium]MCB0810319.1 transcriptional regulator [Flavobacteriales bacterium]MCB0814080.1 transcriptional regulator [Flavobacteriales bacterium]MCB0816620.1 transcriptional regulator [Flavobacteriales bacterium]MCB9182117.1 transcriptional regulator [Flavobacteriales bacterium]
MPFAPLDPLLHNQLRLAVVSLLVNVESADFTWLLEKTGATRGNLSVQLSKLKDAGYIKVKKTFKGSYPNTSCSLTAKGLKAFEGYVEAIKGYLEQ